VRLDDLRLLVLPEVSRIWSILAIHIRAAVQGSTGRKVKEGR